MKEINFLRPISPETMIPALPIGLEEGKIETVEVTLDLAKVDHQWKKDNFSYSGINGGDRKEKKIQGICKSFENTNDLHMPIFYITNNEPENIFFVDGRHTTAFLYESGYKKAVFIIPKIQEEIIKFVFS